MNDQTRIWHKENKMPKNPTLEQRANWHREHVKNCGCRPIPRSLSPKVKKKRI